MSEIKKSGVALKDRWIEEKTYSGAPTESGESRKMLTDEEIELAIRVLPDAFAGEGVKVHYKGFSVRFRQKDPKLYRQFRAKYPQTREGKKTPWIMLVFGQRRDDPTKWEVQSVVISPRKMVEDGSEGISRALLALEEVGPPKTTKRQARFLLEKGGR